MNSIIQLRCEETEMIEYNGYIISITKYTKNSQIMYCAESIRGGFKHCDENEELAIRLVKQDIDNIETFINLRNHPLRQDERDRIKEKIISENKTIHIKYQLKNSHYLTEYNNFYLNSNYLRFHTEDIEKLLKQKENYSINLKFEEIEAENKSLCFVYDLDFYKSEGEVFELKQRLCNMYMEEFQNGKDSRHN